MARCMGLPRSRCDRDIWAGSTRDSHFQLGVPAMPQVIGEEMPHPEGIVREVWNYPWLLHGVIHSQEMGAATKQGQEGEAPVVWGQ